MKYDTDIPIYIQIIEKIKNDILNGTLVPGEKLPSMQEMAVTMEVNQNTILRAYKDCESLGIIETKRGIGSFVIGDQELINRLRTEKVTLIIDAFIRDLEALGYSRAEIIDLIKDTIGRTPDTIIGKPFISAGERIQKRFNASKENIVMVGDRLNTDIAFGNNCGFKSILVLSGETDTDMLSKSKIKPSMVLNSVKDIVR